MKSRVATRNALRNVLDAVSGESVIVICDDTVCDVGEAFSEGALDLGMWVRAVHLESKGLRKEVPGRLHEIITSARPDIFITLLRGYTEETPFRIKVTKMITRKRVRLAHCPGIRMDMLTDGAMSLNDGQYKKMQTFADTLMDSLQDVVSLHLTSDAGSNFTIKCKDREFFSDTKINWKSMKWMNLPVGEVMVGPIENSMEGPMVADMAIGGIGPIKSPLTIKAKKGKAIEVKSKERNVLKRVNAALDTDAGARHIGEFAFGLNPRARFVEEFLESEKMLGTCHIAFGNNFDFPGGKNMSKNHMDFLMNKPTVEATRADGSTFIVLQNGKFKIK